VAGRVNSNSKTLVSANLPATFYYTKDKKQIKLNKAKSPGRQGFLLLRMGSCQTAVALTKHILANSQ